MTDNRYILPPWIIIDPLLQSWLQEDIGRGDRTTQGIFTATIAKIEAGWIAKEAGTIAGLPIAARVFELLDDKTNFIPTVVEGRKSCFKFGDAFEWDCDSNQTLYRNNRQSAD
jgi:nicotinate-nucleotide pyrophosphorylase